MESYNNITLYIQRLNLCLISLDHSSESCRVQENLKGKNESCGK